MTWHECSNCWAEFSVESEVANASVQFCPFCGSELDIEDEDDEPLEDDF